MAIDTRKAFVCYFVVAVFVVSTNTTSDDENTIVQSDAPPEDMQSLSIMNNLFSKDVFLKLPKETDNVFFSPLTLTTALNMVFLGARKGTAREMGRVLRHHKAGLMKTRQVHKEFQKLQGYLENKLSYTNGVVLQHDFNITPVYRRNLKKFYASEVQKVDFKSNGGLDAQKQINEWVSQATNDMIPEFLKEPLDPLTVLFIMSAVYFKGTWNTTFPEELTRVRTFYNYGTTPVEVPMMRMIAEPLMYAHDPENGISAVELPYEGGDFSMLIVLPDAGGELPLAKAQRVTESELEIGRISALMTETFIDITLPKFRIETDYDLVPVLKSLGMKKVFHPGIANLSGIDKSDAELHVDKVVHKAVIEVNEEGTEAAAVSGVSLMARSSPIHGVDFNVNHPFMFFIRDVQSGLIIFSGRVTKL